MRFLLLAILLAVPPHATAAEYPPELVPGPLVIVGGGAMPEAASSEFLKLAGGAAKAKIVVIPTAGAAADDAKAVDSYEGTLSEKRFREVLERGGVIGGSSAGASIQAEYMPRGHPLGNTVVAAEGYEHGFGYLPGCAVDQHFFARKRPADMTGLMKQYPQLLGIGIDEGTGIVVKGTTAEVIGKTKVAFFDTNVEPKEGEKDYVEVPSGGKYDLKNRKKLD